MYNCVMDGLLHGQMDGAPKFVLYDMKNACETWPSSVNALSPFRGDWLMNACEWNERDEREKNKWTTNPFVH